MHPSEAQGAGLRRVDIKLGQRLYQGKWLSIGEGRGQQFGPNHVLVHEFRHRPKAFAQGHRVKNVAVNFRNGETSTPFDRVHTVQSRFGLAIVFKANDTRPYLLDAASGKLVSAMPLGVTDFAFGENYWLHLSNAGKRVWVVARTPDGREHLYEWIDRTKPPVGPSSPFPFIPARWEPSDATLSMVGDSDEVLPANWSGAKCERAIMDPPRDFDCVDYDDQGLSGGWRYDKSAALVYNRVDGRGFDLRSLCPGELHAVWGQVESRNPPRLRLFCDGDPGTWMVWTPPDRVQQLAPELASKIHRGERAMTFYTSIGRYVLDADNIRKRLTMFDTQSSTWFVVGETSSCHETWTLPGGDDLFAIVCRDSTRRPKWVDIASRTGRTLGRVEARDLVIATDDTIVAVVRRGAADQLITATL